jgi:hypothetical protein
MYHPALPGPGEKDGIFPYFSRIAESFGNLSGLDKRRIEHLAQS